MSDAGLYRKLLYFLLKIRSLHFTGLQGTLFLPFTPCHELFDKVGGTEESVQSPQSKGNLRRSFIENCEKFDFQVDQKCIITKKLRFIRKFSVDLAARAYLSEIRSTRTNHWMTTDSVGFVELKNSKFIWSVIALFIMENRQFRKKIQKWVHLGLLLGRTTE